MLKQEAVRRWNYQKENWVRASFCLNFFAPIFNTLPSSWDGARGVEADEWALAGARGAPTPPSAYYVRKSSHSWFFLRTLTCALRQQQLYQRAVSIHPQLLALSGKLPSSNTNHPIAMADNEAQVSQVTFKILVAHSLPDYPLKGDWCRKRLRIC